MNETNVSNSVAVTTTWPPLAQAVFAVRAVVVLALPNLDDAVAMLSKHPALPFGVGIEIRPIHEEISRIWDAKVGRIKSTRAMPKSSLSNAAE